jgi:integrase
VLTAVCEYLKFGAVHGWVPLAAVSGLSEPKFLRHLPPGYDPGESGQFRAVSARAFRFAVAEEGYEALTPEQIAKMVRLASRSRDKLLIVLLGCTGTRIGEALGLRGQDMHLLASSRALGCEIERPHVHVRRRRENAKDMFDRLARTAGFAARPHMLRHIRRPPDGSTPVRRGTRGGRPVRSAYAARRPEPGMSP